MSIGPWQIFIIIVAILLLFGAGKIPKLMSDMAKGLRAFKNGLEEDNKVVPQKKTVKNAPKKVLKKPAKVTKKVVPKKKPVTVKKKAVKKPVVKKLPKKS